MITGAYILGGLRR